MKSIRPILGLFLLAFHFYSFAQCTPGTAITELSANNVRATMLNGGDMWWNFAEANYEVPAGSGVHSLFAGALWLGAKDSTGNIRLASQRYRQVGNDFFPGPIDAFGDAFPESCDEFDRHWKVSNTMINDFLAGANPIPEPILSWPGKGNPNYTGLDAALAPFVDANGDGTYNAQDGDYPQIKGDEAIWWVYNDIGNLHTNSGGGQLGVEVHVMAYAYATNDNLNNTTHYNYTIINKSDEAYHDFYIGVFTDVDLGNSQNDFVGCQPDMDMGFALNGTAFDPPGLSSPGYGFDIPQIGLRMMKQPNDMDGSLVGMSSFGYMNNNSGALADPGFFIEYYNRLTGHWNDGVPYTNGGSGYDINSVDTSKFLYPGNPSENTEWSECSAMNSPGDRRFVQSFGPLDLDPQHPVTFNYAVVWVQDSTFSGGCDDIGILVDATNEVKDFTDNTLCSHNDVTVSSSVTDETYEAQNGSIQLTIGGSQNGSLFFNWSTGASTQNIDSLAGDTAYSVTITDGFGCTTTESVAVMKSPIGIGSIGAAQQFSLFPNPSANGQFNIRGQSADYEVEVFDMIGKTVSTGRATHMLDLGNQPGGFYYVRLDDGQHSEIHKVLITK